jgi:NADH:ubiquinone oxidoreductase subunit C
VRIPAQEQALPVLREKLGGRLLDATVKSPVRIFLLVSAADIVEVSRVIFRDLEARLQTATATDAPDAFEILYHWAFDYIGCVVSVRVKLDKQKPEIDSIAPLCRGAEWIEREMWELMGIVFRGHPDLRHLLLMDDWPAGKFPLRRDFKGLNA